MSLATIEVTVYRSDAASLRKDVLDKRRLDGLTYRVTSPWWWFLSKRYELTAPTGVLESTKAQIKAWRAEVWGDAQW